MIEKNSNSVLSKKGNKIFAFYGKYVLLKNFRSTFGMLYFL